MATYVIGDIHGCYLDFLGLYQKILQRDSDARFILIGDIIDRGDYSIPMLEWAMKNVDQDKCCMVLGNHEFEKLSWWSELHDKNLYASWSDRYDFHKALDLACYTPEMVQNVIDWFDKLPCYIDIMVNGKRFIVVHAFLSEHLIHKDGTLTPNDELTYQDKSDIVWERVFTPLNIAATLICGHTPTISRTFLRECPDAKPGQVYITDKFCNVDCGGVFRIPESNLAALCLDTMEVVYAEDCV